MINCCIEKCFGHNNEDKVINKNDKCVPQLPSSNKVKVDCKIVKNDDSLLSGIIDTDNYNIVIINIIEKIIDCIDYILHMPSIIFPIIALFYIYLCVFFIKISPYIFLFKRFIIQTVLLPISKNKRKFYILFIIMCILLIVLRL